MALYPQVSEGFEGSEYRKPRFHFWGRNREAVGNESSLSLMWYRKSENISNEHGSIDDLKRKATGWD